MSGDSTKIDDDSMNLRAWLAGMAMQGLISNPNTPDQLIGFGWKGSKDAVADYAIACADAVISALKRESA